MSDFEIRAESYVGATAQALIAQIQQEYVVRYGGPDVTAVDAAEFTPPQGEFLVGYLDGQAIACGGWRRLTDVPGAVEIKRMYVVPADRRKGLSRLLLAAIEDSIRAAGHTRIVLETGLRQPEAIALYESSGYAPIDGYGYYRDAPLARSFGKDVG